MVRKRRVSILKKWLNCLFPAEQVSPLSNRVFEWQFEIGRCATSSKIVEKIFFFVKLFHFLINNRIKNHEKTSLKTCNDFLRSWVTGTELNFW